MVAPKRLITLDARTDAIAERVKRGSTYGFSHWVRCRLIEAAEADAPAYLPAPVAEREAAFRELKRERDARRIWSTAVRMLIEKHEPDLWNFTGGIDAHMFDAYAAAREHLMAHGWKEGDE